MTGRYLAMISVGFLSACMGDQTPPRIIHDPVPTPVPVPCVAAEDIPARPGPLPPRPPGPSAALDMAISKVLEWQNYGAVVDPILQGCKKP